MPDRHMADTITLGTSKFWLASANNKAIFSSGDRILQNVPSDDFEKVWDDFSGLGKGFYAGDDFLTAIQGKLYPRPAVTRIVLSAGQHAFGALAIADWFETGNYLFVVGRDESNGVIVKIDISVATPVIKRIYNSANATFSLNANDRYGQPAQMYSARATAGYRWYIPCNNGTRILALDAVSTEASQAFSPSVTLNEDLDASETGVDYTSAGDAIVVDDIIIVDSERMRVTAVNTGTNTLTVIRGWAGTTAATHTNTTAVTQSTPDTFSVVTAVVGGASHFKRLPSGKVWRSNASLSAGAVIVPSVAKVSAMLSGSDAEADASWGEDFPVDDETVPITSLMNYDELLVVGKQNGWFSAAEGADLKLTWRGLLPDANIVGATTALVGTERWRKGIVWHGRMELPTNTHLHRSTLFSEREDGPDIHREITGDEIATGNKEMRYGNITSLAAIGPHIYSAYHRTATVQGTTSFVEMLVGHEGDEARPIDWELLWKHTLTPTTGSTVSVYIQKTSTGAPRLWAFSSQGPLGGMAFEWIDLAPDGGPYDPTATYGNASVTARLWLMPLQFPTNALLREWQYLIEDGGAECAWGLEYALDGGSALTTISSTVTASGRQSLYFTPGTNDVAKSRVMPIIKATFSSGYTPTATPPRLVGAALYGCYLPKTGEDVTCTIDLETTAEQRGTTVEAVAAELLALRLPATGSTAYEDRFGTAGRILLRHTQWGLPASAQGIVGDAYMQLMFSILVTA